MSVQRHVCEPSSSSSSSGSPLNLQWGDLEGNFASLQLSIEARLKELEIKETQVKDRLGDLESREREFLGLTQNRAPFDCGPGSTNGKKLLSLLIKSASEHERVCEQVRRALVESEDPGKLVLDAVAEFHNQNVGSSGAAAAGKRICVVLLEQLAEAAPRIGPAEKAEAARLSREWRAKIREEGRRGGVLGVLGFLLLVGAYDLVDEFDSGDMFGVFRSIGQPGLPSSSGGEDPSFEEPGWADNEPDIESTVLGSVEKTDQSLDGDFELVNQIASAFTSTFEALKCFCVGMDGKNLKLFLYQYVEEHDSWSTKVREALCHAPDPAKLVLHAIPGFLRSQPEFNKSLTMAKVRKICVLLLEQLITISPPINPSVREEALKLASQWGSNLGQGYQRPVIVYGFLLLLAAYRLGPSYDKDELLRLLGIATQYNVFPGLYYALGFTDKVEVFIQSLIQKMMFLDAVDNAYAYGLVDLFQPVRLLKNYLNYSRKRIYKKGDQSSLQQKQAISKEIAAIKTVIKYIAKYKLEKKYPPGALEKQILQLEKKKGNTNESSKSKSPKADPGSNVPSPSVLCGESASATVDSQVNSEGLKLDDQVAKSKPSPKEESQLNDEEVKSEKPEPSSNSSNQAPFTQASPWPRLESFCINVYGKGVSFFSHKHKEGPSSAVSSSSPASPWPELKSFCVNMDGKGLRMFVYDHIDDENKSSFCSEVHDALKHVSDPAKLILDAMPGCLRSQPEFDASLKMKKVRNTRILLLEQLIAVSPPIGPPVTEEALKMANEWRANLGFKFKAPDNVYGFLHFVAAYDLVSSFDKEELLGLLGPANQHRACPGLCRVLGFADKASAVIDNLIQMSLVVEAIEHIYAYEIDRFSPVMLLKDYLKSIKVRKDGPKPPSKKAIEQEIAAVRSVIKCVGKYKLESELPPKRLERRIAKLEKQKPGLQHHGKVLSSRNVQP